MKILHVLAQLPARTGSGVYYSNLIRGLAAYGHAQRALYAYQAGQDICLPDGCYPHPVEFQSAALPFPIVGMSDVMPYPTLTYAELDEAKLTAWQKAFGTALAQEQAEFTPDIIILHHLWMLTSLAVDIFPQAVKIGVCHNTDIRQAEQHPALKARYVTQIPHLDAIFALSEQQRHTIARTYGVESSKIMNMGGGFDDSLFYPAKHKAPRETINLVFSAKIAPSKGVYELIRAFQLISRHKPNLHLDIIGTPDAEGLRRLYATIQATDNISVLPIKQQPVLAEYIREQDIFVMPSYFEGLGLMALESLASGLWVVATEIAGLMALLGPQVNGSGVIEYVPLPRIYDTDKPFAEDLDVFVAALAEKLLCQVAKAERQEHFPQDVLPELHRHSWSRIAEHVQQVLMNLYQKRLD